MVYAKSLLFIILCLWAYQLIVGHGQWIFLDNANLIFHEAGHFIFFFTGSTLQLLAGSFMQLLIPLICLLNFTRQSHFFSVSFCLFWFGESLNNVSLYVRDAQDMQLPLIGGVHDWNTLFSQYNILESATGIANFIQTLGTLFMLAGLSFMLIQIIKIAISNHVH